MDITDRTDIMDRVGVDPERLRPQEVTDARQWQVELSESTPTFGGLPVLR